MRRQARCTVAGGVGHVKERLRYCTNCYAASFVRRLQQGMCVRGVCVVCAGMCGVMSCLCGIISWLQMQGQRDNMGRGSSTSLAIMPLLSKKASAFPACNIPLTHDVHGLSTLLAPIRRDLSAPLLVPRPAAQGGRADADVTTRQPLPQTPGR